MYISGISARCHENDGKKKREDNSYSGEHHEKHFLRVLTDDERQMNSGGILRKG